MTTDIISGVRISICKLGQTNLISGSTDFFSKFEGSVGRKKRKIKKKSPIFCIGFDYQ